MFLNVIQTTFADLLYAKTCLSAFWLRHCVCVNDEYCERDRCH